MDDKEEDADWMQDAQFIVEDVKNHVHHISISNSPDLNGRIIFNLTILEMKDFCVELSPQGFQIIGEKYDSDDKRANQPVFETFYSLLDSVSPGYRKSFGEHLLLKLNQLKEDKSNN